jgi:hypothetical protein
MRVPQKWFILTNISLFNKDMFGIDNRFKYKHSKRWSDSSASFIAKTNVDNVLDKCFVKHLEVHTNNGGYSNRIGA